MKTPQDQVLDEWLLLQLQAGNKQALPLLFKRWNKKMIRQANIYTHDLQIAQDIAQEVWLVVVKDIHKLKDASKYGSWTLTITTRKAIDWLRKQKKDRTGIMDIDEEQAEEQGSFEEDRIAALRKAMKFLEPEQISILSLYYSEGHSVNAIAEILNIPAGTVKSRLYHARNKLKQKIKLENHED